MPLAESFLHFHDVAVLREHRGLVIGNRRYRASIFTPLKISPLGSLLVQLVRHPINYFRTGRIERAPEDSAFAPIRVFLQYLGLLFRVPQGPPYGQPHSGLL